MDGREYETADLAGGPGRARAAERAREVAPTLAANDRLALANAKVDLEVAEAAARADPASAAKASAAAKARQRVAELELKPAARTAA